MKGNETGFLDFMEGGKLRFIIPVYQRKYEWKTAQCRQLFNDLKKVMQDGRSSHFFGSIVSGGNRHECIIIDGQQRLTTVTLLLLAIRDYVTAHPELNKEKLDKEISEQYLTARWTTNDDGDLIKLRLVKSDRDALNRLIYRDNELDHSSNLTNNYEYFLEELGKANIEPKKLFEAIGRLEVISISLDKDDDPQLIFESLNSTGLALTEGDKIRNYLLMGVDQHTQERYYHSYWEKIETCTDNDVSAFVRDYLSVKQQVTPNIRNVYQDFKRFVEEGNLGTEPLLEDLLRYARIFRILITGVSGLENRALDACLGRFCRLGLDVVRPFFMEIFRLHQDGELTQDDVLAILRTTESYLLRRNICEVPTSALNKIFVSVNRDVLRFDGTSTNYLDKYVRALLTKRDSSRFPNDEEFCEALSRKNVYNMRGAYKVYLLERFENYGTSESKDVYARLEHNEYTIEHIMPQHLTNAWTHTLGPNYEEIHSTWLHRLANLTLTGYNPSLSNKSFEEKRDAPVGGFKNSGLRMNQKIAQKTSWGLPELEERNQEMLALALEIWPYPKSGFMPAQKVYDSVTLADDDFDATGYGILKYSLFNVEQPASSWLNMFERVVRFLHLQDRSVLPNIASGTYGSANGMDSYVANEEGKLRQALKIDDHLYVEKNTSTSAKLRILRKLFYLYDVNPMELVIYLRDRGGENGGK